MPTNTYGPNDNYDEFSSHFIPALIKKVHRIKNKKKNIKYLGNRQSIGEIIYVDDVADACIHFMRIKSKRSLINIGTGKDLTINQYANKILKVLKVKAKIKHDKSKPDGTPKKLLDISIAKNMDGNLEFRLRWEYQWLIIHF